MIESLDLVINVQTKKRLDKLNGQWAGDKTGIHCLGVAPWGRWSISAETSLIDGQVTIEIGDAQGFPLGRGN